MFDDFLELIKTLARKFFSSRLAPLALLFSCMFIILVVKLFNLQIVQAVCRRTDICNGINGPHLVKMHLIYRFTVSLCLRFRDNMKYIRSGFLCVFI